MDLIAWVIGKAVPETNLFGETIGYIGTIIDITARRQAEEKLRHEQILLRTLIDNIPDVIYIKDKSCRKIIANLADIKNMGLKNESDVIGKSDFDLFPKEIAEKFFKDDQSVIQSGTPILNREELLIDSGGKQKWLLTSKLPLTDERGEISGLVGIGHDITEQKKVEDALKESEFLLKVSQRVAGLGHYTLDVSNGKWESSEILDEIFGIDETYPKDVEGWLRIIHPDHREKMKIYFIEDVLGKHKRFDNEYQIIRLADGEVRWVHGIGELEFDKDDNPIQMIGTIQDITDRKKTEKELQESEERFRSLYENSTVGIYRTTRDGKILLANPTLVKILGFNSFDDLAKVNLSKHGFETTDERIRFIESVEKEGEIKGLEFNWKKKDGTIVCVRESARAVRDGNGRTIYYDGTIEDITEKKIIENSLHERQNQLSQAAEVARLGPWEYDALKNQFIFNDYFYKLFHTTVDQVGSYTMSPSEYVDRFFFPKDAHLIAEEMKLAMESTNPDLHRQLEHRIKYADGKPGYITVDFFIIKDNNGRTIRIYGVNQDITERKLAEEEIRQSETEYRTLFENAHDAILVLNAEDEIVMEVNDRACELYGFAKDEFIGMSLKKLSKNVEDGRKKIKTILTNGYITNFETAQHTKQGDEIIVEINASIIDYKGKKAILSLNHDITKRKIAERNILVLSKAIEQNTASIIITDAKGEIEYVNPMFTKVTGYSPEEVIGQNPGILNSGYHSREFFANLWKTILSGKDFACEMYNKKKNGELFWENVIISSIVDEKGIITHFVAVKEDITEKKNTIEELIVAKEKAEEMNRLKSNFLANMSHELRTPLVGIIGYSEFLCKDLTDPGLKEMSEAIYNSSKKLTETLNLILDLSKIESDKLELIPEKFEIVTASLEIVNSFKEFAHKKGVYLKSEFESPKLFANLDIRAFRSILNNLLNNAIKFTNTGGVTVNLSQDKVNEKDFAVIKVTDTGIGISKENHNQVFEDFRQVSEGLDRNFQGSGLGLSITKKFVEKLHGTISIDSELGKGSTFTVRLPLSSEGVQSIQAESNKENKSMHFDSVASILIVDDDENINNIIRNYLPSKFDVTYTKDAYDAFKFAGKKKFDLIFMDINLKKDLDGKQAAQEIRKIKGYENTPIVACTAYAMEGDKEEFLSAGCSHYLSKPFSKEEILLLLDEILQLSAKTEKECT